MLPLIHARISSAEPVCPSAMRAVADITWPGVQYPHWNASCSRKARCTGCNSPSAANPSIVVTSASATVTASVMQASTRRPATCTVQAPHSPRSQPIFVPVSPNRSRKASSSVTRGSNTMTCALPLTRNVISRSSSNLTPQMYLPVCPAAQISAHFAEIYGASVSKETISQITDRVREKMTDWCSRPVDCVYAAILVDAVMVKVRDGQVANRPIYAAIGVTLAGERDILGRRCRPHSGDPAVMPEEPVGGTEQMRMLSDPGT